MNVLRAHDYPAREPDFQPNVRALRGILVALAVTAFFCFCVAIALLPGLHTKPMAVASPRCTCRAACRLAMAAKGQDCVIANEHSDRHQ
jgi:hypothetical protein